MVQPLVDSVEQLEQFHWSNPLRSLCRICIDKNMNEFVNPVLVYQTYFDYLTVIWVRFREELEQYHLCITREEELRPKTLGIHEWSSEERDLYYLEKTLITQLQLEYESFIIFSRVLMDKVTRLAQLLIGSDGLPSHNSFDDHKGFFRKTQSIPYPLNEDYARLIRDETDWFDNALKASRDKIMVHSYIPWSGALHSPTRGLRFMRANMFSGAVLEKESNVIISLKQKYLEKYPELKEVPDNLWEIIEFFMYHNVEFDTKDKGQFYTILHMTGAQLPSLHYIARCLIDFLRKFADIFEKTT